MKAQASMEYMLLFGFSLIIVAVLWTVSGTNIEDTKWELSVSYAKNTLNKITQTADSIYVQGMPAQSYITIEIPENTNAVYIDGNSVTIEMRWKGILRNITKESIANLTGTINSAPGSHNLRISATLSSVNIEEA